MTITLIQILAIGKPRIETRVLVSPTGGGVVVRKYPMTNWATAEFIGGNMQDKKAPGP